MEPPMTEHDALLRSILENPDDDAPRLALASHLEAQGATADAEFIRVQCARAQLPKDDPTRRSLARRATILLAENGRRWQASLRELGVREVEFERGLPKEVTISGEDLLRNAEALFALAPIQVLRVFPTKPESALALANLTLPVRVRELDLSFNRLGDQGVEALACNPSLSHLTKLNLKECGFADVGARALAGSTQLANLTALDLESNRITDDGALVLAASQSLPALQELIIGWNHLTDEGYGALAASDSFPKLTKLGWTDPTLQYGTFSTRVSEPQSPPSRTDGRSL
jgi:uncharacterized protein (TIGR02996 family)